MAQPENRQAPGSLKRVWRWFWTPTGRFAWGGILLAGIVVGAVLLGGFHAALEVTNTQAFCTSCHEMSAFVQPEYEESAHYRNTAGVRATCPDCHVPRAWGPKVVRKVRATNELYHKAVGTISTREKFDAARLELAGKVWRTMKSTDSRECRNCHSFTAMDIDAQRKRARRFHAEAPGNNETCIDCHQGIAHKLPDGWEEHYDKAVGRH